ncbi:MRN complex-interacting protein [Battus philenor]|uniref:MRN complex-interacting protein n=1 Tax=Battus philenor TaxID=42288 RepID=UPI0035D08F2B
MPQLFQVLRCYKCLVFQIHQTKKSNKWQCKMCGEKQSIKRHYGLGNGKECRLHVQKLNVLRGQMEEVNVAVDSDSYDEDKDNDNHEEETLSNKIKSLSKWSIYTDEVEDEPQEVDTPLLENTEVCSDAPKKRKKYNNLISKNKRSLYGQNEETDYFKTYTGKCKENSVVCEIEPTKLPIKTSNTKFELTSQEKDSTIMEVNKKKPVEIISKWNKYVEVENELNFKDECTVNTQNIFHLCEDSELDTVLNF